jgi:hypothetical protein
MLYAALTFWLLIIVFSAWGVHTLLSQLIKPKVVNSILLPGTLVAQLGHVLGLLITGNEVRGTALMGKDESGDPTAEAPAEQKIPLIASVVVGLLPVVACAAALYWAKYMWGNQLFEQATVEVVQTLPHNLSGFWDLLRNSIDAMQQMSEAIAQSNLSSWPTLLFLYLALCLTVRMAPFPGHRRGALVAVTLAGLLIAIIGLVDSRVAGIIEQSWPIVSFAVGMLLLLLLIALTLSGVVGLVRVFAKNE